jgi:hypothetical protein
LFRVKNISGLGKKDRHPLNIKGALGNQNPYIEEEQTTQWPKEKGQTTIYKTYT